MRSNWKEIPRGDVMPQYAGIHVTMNRKGAIVMSRRTFERFGAPKAVLVMFDEVNNRIGLKPAGPGTRNAHPVNVANTKTGSKIVRCYRLIVEARIDLPGTVEFPDAEITPERILILDLRTARPSARARARRERRTS